MENFLTFAIIGILLLGIGLAQPLYVLLGALVCVLLLFGTNVYDDFESLQILIEQTRGLAENEVLLAIPFFVISGAIMSEGDISRRLVSFARGAFRGIPGGLAVSGVLGCVFFAAISGSSPVTVIAIGSIVFPAMAKEGYRENFSSGLLSSAGSLGILIPPSIPMIVYSIVDPQGLADPATYSIAPDNGSIDLVDLFIAGLGPGLLLGGIFVFASMLEGARRETLGKNGLEPTFLEKLATLTTGLGRFLVRVPLLALLIGSLAWIPILLFNRFKTSEGPAWLQPGTLLYDVTESFWDSFWALMLPVIILGGIYSGLFTPTEAACVSVVYALLVELFLYRSLTLQRVPDVLSDSTVLIGALLIIIAVAQGFNRFLIEAEVPEKLVALILDMQLSTVAFLMVINIMLLVVGAFMDIMSAILILVPLLSPVAYQLGIHPLHLAVVFIVNLEIGYLTPPLGLNLFVASTIFDQPISRTIRSVLPFIGMMIAGLLIVTYVPTVSLGPVSVSNGHGFYVPFPERKIPMDRIQLADPLRFLGSQAEEEEAAEDNSGSGPGGELTMAELMAQAEAELEAENSQGDFQSLDEFLCAFQALADRRVRLQDLSFWLDNGNCSEAP